MSYKITCENFTICETNNPELICSDVHLSRELNYAGLLKFSINKLHPYYENIGTGQIIRCYIDGVLKFTGEITSSKGDLQGTKAIKAMGLLYKFSQTVQDYSANQNYTLLDFITKVINYHNSQIGDKWQIQVGNITVIDPNDNVYRGLSYETTQDVFKYKLMEQLGGYMQIREENNQFYFDYLADYTNINSQGLHFGENVINLNLSKAHEDVYNVIFPVGAKLNIDTEERVTIASVNGGALTIRDEDSVSAFGERVLSVQYNDVTEPSNLLTKAYADLETHKDLLWQFDFTAIDLAKININYNAFNLGDYAPITIPVYAIDTISQITGIDDDLSNPTRSKIYCGKKVKTSTGNKLQVDKVINQINKNYVTNQTVGEIVDSKTGEIAGDVQETLLPLIESNTSLIQQEADNIRFEVSAEYSTKDELVAMESLIVEQTSSQLEIKFNTVNQDLIDLGDRVEINKIEQEKYIRFVDGEIQIGEEGSPLGVEIDNTELRFIENGQRVAYVSNNSMYITNAEVENSLRIGAISLFREENGTMSIL